MLATWNIVVRRVVSDRLMFVAAAVTVLLSITVLAAGPIYSDAVSLASLHRVLENGESGSNLEIVSRTRGEHFESQNLIVREQVARSFSLTGAGIYTKVRGSAYELPVESDDDLVNMASIQYLEEIESRATLVAGTWAVAGAEPFEVTVHAGTASLLGLEIGDELALTNRHSPALQTSVRVVGMFMVDDLAETYWHDDAILEAGVEESGSFRYYGPFVVALDTVLGEFAFPNADMRWRVLPHHQLLRVDDIPEQGGAAASLAGLLNEQVAIGGNEFRVTTELATILTSAEQSIAATRSSVLMLSVQLAILAGFALMQTAGLLVDSRRTETGLLRARGSGNGQILSLAVMEGILLTIPAVLLAPPLAALMLRSLNVVGPLAGIGLMFQPEINSAALPFQRRIDCFGPDRSHRVLL